MKRRTFLKATATTPLMAAPVVAAEEDSVVENVARNFFDALPGSKEERNNTVVECANDLCRARNAVSKEALDAVVEGGGSADKLVRRTQFGVRILNEYSISKAVDESMIEKGRRNLGRATRYIPLVGSFNRLCEAACAVETPEPDGNAVTDFLYSCIAFGVEVALWTVGAPYKMAWNGTHFIANRTFLRFARHGCSGCVAFLMSELHWAIRASVYGHGVTEHKVEFVWEKIEELKEESQKLDYDVDLDYSYEEVEDLVESEGGAGAAAVFPQENDGPIEGVLPDIKMPEFEFDFDIEIQRLTDFFD